MRESRCQVFNSIRFFFFLLLLSARVLIVGNIKIGNSKHKFRKFNVVEAEKRSIFLFLIFSVVNNLAIVSIPKLIL